MNESHVMVITGSSRGIGRYLAEHFTAKGFHVYGCSRGESDLALKDYTHFTLDVTDEEAVKAMFASVRKREQRLDILINNAGCASMNHALLTPLKTIQRLMEVNYTATFLFSREAVKLMKRDSGRIVNLVSVAVPLKLEGEAAYASSKAAVLTLTQILAREFADMNVTVNAIGPTPVDTHLIAGVSHEKLQKLLDRQAIKRMGRFEDVSNVVDFFIRPESNFITGQVIYLGGV